MLSRTTVDDDVVIDRVCFPATTTVDDHTIVVIVIVIIVVTFILIISFFLLTFQLNDATRNTYISSSHSSAMLTSP